MIDLNVFMKENNIKALSYKATNEVNVFLGVNSKCKAIDKNTLFNTCSISKLLTAIAILQAKDEKLLNLEENVNKYLIDWKLEDKEVHVEDLLIDQSGISDVEGSFETYDRNIGKVDILKLLNGETSYFKKKIVVTKEPRKEFIYSDNNGLILEKLL